MNANPSLTSPRSLATPYEPLRKWLFAAFASWTVLVSATNALAQSPMTIPASIDSEASSGTTTNNFGACNVVYTGGSSGDNSRGLFYFDLSSVPTGVTITSATLELTTVTAPYSNSSTSRNIGVHQITQSWTEGTGTCYPSTATANVTWNNRTTGTPWTTAGVTHNTTAVATTTVSSNNTYSWNVTSLVQGWYASPATNFGLLTKATTTDSDFKAFASRTNSSTTSQPRLVINYTVNCTVPGGLGGATSVCQGATANVTPSSGGTWTSSNNSVAVVSNTGLVTGVSPGVVTLTYTETGTGNTCSKQFTVTGSFQGGDITVVDSKTAIVTGPDTITIAKPTGLQVGDLMIANINIREGATTPSPMPTGWVTRLTYNHATANRFVWIGYKVAVAADLSASNYSFNFAGTSDLAGGITAFRGVDVASSNGGIQVTGTPYAADNGNPLAPASITTLSANSMVVFLGQVQSINFNTSDWLLGGSSGSVMTQLYQVNPTSVAGVGAAALKKTTAGATGAGYKLTANGRKAGVLLALKVASDNTILGGASSVCAGSTASVTPSTGGVWSSSNNSIATVDNSGVVTGVSAGTVTLTFTDGSCAFFTKPFTVTARPVVGGGSLGNGTGNLNFEYYDTAPAGDTVDNNPTFGPYATGTASSIIANPTTPFSARFFGFIRISTSGSYTFFTNSDDGSKLFINNQLVVSNDGAHASQEVSGIVSLTPGWYPIRVEYFNSIGSGSLSASYQGPSISKQAIPGSILSTTAPTPALSLCVGGTANVTPSAGGTWVSSNPAVASVTNAGVVSGLTAGSATLTFTDATGCSSSVSTTIVAGPSLGGATSVCVGQTANVTPNTGGTWVSSNPAIASITNAGVVTGQSAGSVTLTFTNTTTGCISSTGFNVIARPTVGGASAVCVGNTATVTPTTGGSWVSSNPAVASVTNAGVVTGQSAGVVTLTFTDTNTGCTNTRTMTVNGLTPLGGANSTCVGIPALVTPNTGGTWVSSNPAVASVSSSGTVNGISGGVVTLSFTNATTGCVSTKSFTVNVPIGQGGGEGIGGATAVCAGFQTNVTPATGGAWGTSNPAIATVNNAGVVTGFSPGVVTLTFTEDGSGCVSTVEFTVYPNVVAGGASSVCQGLSANVTPTSNGTWVSSDPTIAFVSNSGIVTGLQPGTVTLTFTSLGGCSDSKSFTVHPKPTALGAATVQVGQTANVTPDTGGTWVSSNPAIATVTDAGVVTGIAEGAVTLTFTNTTTGCIGTKALAVIDPGFYKNESMTDSGDKTDPDPENNQDPEVVFPQSFTALVVTVFQDVDGDEDGDEPVPAVTITLRDAEGNTVAVVTTGLDGSYTFDDLPPGFYTVEQHVPNGNFTYTTNPFPITVVLNEVERVDFVNSQLGQISGTIYANNGDDVMANVVVSLLDENGDPVLDSNDQPIVTSTNDAGFYVFDRVPIGTYQVQQTVPSGFVAVDDVDGSDLTVNGDVTPIVIGPGTVIVNQNFINFEPGKIVGNVSIDTDLDLGGDQAHSGVTVSVFRPGFGPDGIAGNSDDNTPIDTTTTDAEGNFTFTDLDPGDYTVVQTVPANFTAVSDSDGGNFTIVGDITTIEIVEGSTGIANFLNQPQTDIAVDKSVNNSTPVVGSNVTFTVVVTNNGPQNATDVNVDDVALGFLYVSHTASKGSFALSPGAPENTFSGLWSVGALNVGESATLTVVATVTPNAVLATYKNSVYAYSELGDPNLTNNEDEVEVDPVFGSISGNVSRDTTGNNLGNTPVQGVFVALVDANGNPVLGSNNLALIAETDVNGNYSFTDLPPGTYRVVETVPAGDVAVNDVDGGNLAINGDTTPITLTGGQSVNNQDFVIAALGSISGTIREDTSGDSQGDIALPGVVVVLLKTDGSPVLDGNNDPITTVTDDFGNYSFPDITPGNYRVAHVPPGGLIAVDDVDGGNLTINGDQTAISVLPGADVTGQDFVDAALGSISGSVLADADDDGDGDTGIPGVTITLVNDSNVTIATTTTNNQGQYSFGNIPAGSYRIVETQPAGYTSVSDVDGGNLDIIGDQTAIPLLPGAALINQDFVEILNATITGIVQSDTNDDNNGDTALDGVTITLLDENDDVVATTTTNPDGSYSFTDLVPGSYTVVETDLPGYTSVTPNSVPVTLPPGGSAFVPFVDEQPGSISGTVFNDLNRLTDNTVNGTGTNAGGLFMNLVNPTGDLVIASIPVNADGTYSFTAANGVSINTSYLLILTPTVRTVGSVLTTSSLPSPWISTGENIGAGAGSDGTANGILAVSVTVGPVPDANFGIVIPPDVTPVITAQPNVMNGTTDFNIRIQVTELNQVNTDGTIVVRVPKDNRWVLREAYDSNLTTLDGVPMNNNNWTYSENATHHIFTTVNPSIFIPGGNFSYFGIKARWSTVAQVGIYTITSQIDSGSGNETRIDNNSDAEKIDFFNN